MIAIDFETYYDDECNVVKLGNYAYCNHENWEALLVSIYCDDFQYVGPVENAPWERMHQAGDLVFCAHNAGFDRTVLNRLVFDGKIPQYIQDFAWVDTADLVAYLGAPRNLAGAAKHLLGMTLDKKVRDDLKGKTVCDERDYEYALNDAIACYKLWVKYSPEWPLGEIKLSWLTRSAHDYGVGVDLEKLNQGIATLKKVIHATVKRIPWRNETTGVRVKKPVPLTSTTWLNKECAKLGIDIPPTTNVKEPEFQAWWAVHGEKADFVAAVQEYRSLNKTLELLKTMVQRTKPSGRMDVGLKYFGAHTGRWAGQGGLNLQNLPRDSVAGVDIRGMLVPAQGKKFIIADLAQIEPRVLAWMVGDEDFLERCREGQSPYEAHARATMGYDKPEPLKQEDPGLYALAKARVLGLGYGCGHRKFVDVAQALAGLKISEGESKRIVDDYRSSNPLILRAWRKLEDELNRHAGHNWLQKLPSSRFLRYFNCNSTHVQVEMSRNHRPAWGGALCENVVQAIARDIFASILLNLHARGWYVQFHVHDEAVLEVDPEVTVEEVVGVMRSPIDWAEGLPIDVEAFEAERFSK